MPFFHDQCLQIKLIGMHHNQDEVISGRFAVLGYYAVVGDRKPIGVTAATLRSQFSVISSAVKMKAHTDTCVWPLQLNSYYRCVCGALTSPAANNKQDFLPGSIYV